MNLRMIVSMKKFNFTMALLWMIYLPLILCVCVVAGILLGIYQITIRVFRQLLMDIVRSPQAL
jgi:hypothetical protein